MIKPPKPTIETVIAELLRRRAEDTERCGDRRRGGGHKKHENQENRTRLAEYFVGRQCFATEAITLLENLLTTTRKEATK